MAESGIEKWSLHFNLPVENLELIGRLVSEELLDMDRPQVSEAFRRVRLKLAGCRWPGHNVVLNSRACLFPGGPGKLKR